MPKIRSLALEVPNVSVPDAVSTIIMRNHVLYESLRLKVVNYHALAAKISHEVEELTAKTVNLDTVVVAIKRFSDNLREEKLTEVALILKDAKLSLVSGVADVTIAAKSVSTIEILEQVLKLVPKLSAIPNIFQLPNSVKVLTEEDDAEIMKKELSRQYSLLLRSNMAKVSIRISPTGEKIPGIASFITDLLFRNGINLIDAFLGYEDIVMIVEEKFGPRTYQLLSEEIRGLA